MRRIEKGAEPACLADLRGTPGASWSSVHGTQRQEMREQLSAEQYGLCAYCMSPLPRPPSEAGMKIEHFKTRAASPEQTFAWSNLLGVCLGEVGMKESAEEDRRARFHCDTYRGQLPPVQQGLDLHPGAFPPDAGACFSYTRAGEMRPAQLPDATMVEGAGRTIERLNLNIDRLKRNRASVIEALRKGFQQKAPKAARVREMLERASTPNRDGLLEPYCQVAVHYLTKKLRQLEGGG